MENLLKRFFRYVSVETTSDETSQSIPSTKGQLAFVHQLENELKELGLSDVKVDESGYLMATIPSNVDREVPTVGFIAHLDTSPDASGVGVKPRIVRYEGSPLALDSAGKVVLAEEDFPELKKYRGEDLVVADGTTLLGADDKAGIAEIISMAAYFQQHPEVEHGIIKIAFTPDEEIGRGADHFNVEAFGADWAYTVDGGELGELEFENFNAAKAVIENNGRMIHPGYAKDKMINALKLAMEIDRLLPSDEVPEKSEGYDGFFYLCDLNGSVDKVSMTYCIRDHDAENFNKRKQLLKDVCERVEILHKGAKFDCRIIDQYRNMKEQVEPYPHIITIAKQAMEQCGVTPKVKPIRGGTDGATLSFKGLPCPNLFAGGLNFHGVYEYIPVKSMELATQVLIEIAKLVVK